MDQVFNELSLSPGHADKFGAHAAMVDVCRASFSLCGLGYAAAVRTTRDFKTRELAPGYTVQNWFTDRELTERDERRYFLAHCSKAPYVEDLHDDAGIDGDEDYRFEGEKALGLTLAFLWDGPALSLRGDVRFAAAHAALTHLRLAEDGSLAEEECVVLLVRRPADVEEQKGVLRNKFYAEVRSGADIVEHARRLFPHLQFCDNAVRQLRTLRGTESYFPEVVRHLRVLEAAINRCGENTGFRPRGIDYAAGESESTTNHPQSRQARRFLCPDGQMREFRAHSKIRSANKRIHLIPDCSAHSVLIGHVGDHLPLA